MVSKYIPLLVKFIQYFTKKYNGKDICTLQLHTSRWIDSQAQQEALHATLTSKIPEETNTELVNITFVNPETFLTARLTFQLYLKLYYKNSFYLWKERDLCILLLVGDSVWKRYALQIDFGGTNLMEVGVERWLITKPCNRCGANSWCKFCEIDVKARLGKLYFRGYFVSVSYANYSYMEHITAGNLANQMLNEL